jgi:hypothetical protein
MRGTSRAAPNRMRTSLFIAVLVALAGGCASNREALGGKARLPRGKAQAAPRDSAQVPGRDCPQLPSAQSARITVAETPEGAAMVFAAKRDVADVRLGVRRMAIIHETVQGMVGTVSTETADLPNLVAAHALVQDIDGGAQLLFVARDAESVPAVREEARRHAELVMLGQCATLSVRPGGGNARLRG